MMRFLIAATAAAAVLLAAAAAQAEKRIFIVANDGDGYGVDRCLASGASCGEAAANAYCKSREFAQAQSYSKVDRDDITGAIPTSGPGACKSGNCENYVAIECSR
jgi:opacity protein-like surface antigen